MQTLTAPVSSAEMTRLAHLETVIETGLATWVLVSQALVAIHDEDLYLITHTNWGSYLEERWGIGRRYADHLACSLKVVYELGTLVLTDDPPPERVVRPLARLRTAEERQKVYVAAQQEAGGRMPTADQVAVKVAKAVAEQTRDEMLDEIRRQETAARAAAPPGRPCERARRLARIAKHLAKARNPAEAMGPEAARLVDLIDAAQAEQARLAGLPVIPATAASTTIE